MRETNKYQESNLLFFRVFFLSSIVTVASASVADRRPNTHRIVSYRIELGRAQTRNFQRISKRIIQTNNDGRATQERIQIHAFQCVRVAGDWHVWHNQASMASQTHIPR